ncbi:MAG TPA: tyrosine-type recombinase/integrase [Nocardioidaceae bacterium]|nr:tyrosine-type recombinase/integrase [Nocardioidaceae bacterium]
MLYRHGGKQASKTFTGRKGNPQKGIWGAEDFAALVDTIGPDKALKQMTDDAPERLTVDELFERWIAWKAKTGITERTLKEYRRDYVNWIQRPLGHRAAETVDELDVQEWVDKISGQLDPKTVGDRHMILGGMFKFGSARSRRLVEHNPCLETQLPSKKKKAPKGFSLAQWDAMCTWAAEHEPDAADLLLFIASTGWRISEVSAMIAAAVDDYGDVEYEGETVPIVYVSVLGVHRRDANDRTIYVEGLAKSEAGVRRINLLPDAAWMVRRRLEGLKPGDLLFTNKRGSMWRPNNLLRSEFARTLKGAGVAKVKGMGPHYLRHTHVGILDRAGVSIAKMQRRIGHEDIQTTLNVYGGTIDNALTVEELVKAQRLLTRGGAAGEIVAGEVLSEGAQTILGELES